MDDCHSLGSGRPASVMERQIAACSVAKVAGKSLSFDSCTALALAVSLIEATFALAAPLNRASAPVPHALPASLTALCHPASESIVPRAFFNRIGQKFLFATDRSHRPAGQLPSRGREQRLGIDRRRNTRLDRRGNGYATASLAATAFLGQSFYVHLLPVGIAPARPLSVDRDIPSLAAFPAAPCPRFA